MVTINDARHHYITTIEQGRLFDVVTQETGVDVFSRNLPDSFLFPQQIPIGGYRQNHSILNLPSVKLEPKRISIFSFFAGAGFLDLGFESNGVKVVYVNEVFRPFLNAYRFAREQLHVNQPEYGYHEGSISDFIEEKRSGI